MPALRVISLMFVALWIGGLAALGAVAAPTIFAVLQSHDPAAGRALAGTVFGAIFERFNVWSWGFGAAVLALLALRTLLGPRPRRLAIQLWLVIGMLGASAYSGLVLAPQIESLRNGSTGPIASLPDGDPRKSSFGRLHGLSNGLMLITFVAGLGLFWIESRE